MKADIIRWIKEEEVPVSQAAKEHRLHEPSTIPVRAPRVDLGYSSADFRAIGMKTPPASPRAGSRQLK